MFFYIRPKDKKIQDIGENFFHMSMTRLILQFL